MLAAIVGLFAISSCTKSSTSSSIVGKWKIVSATYTRNGETSTVTYDSAGVSSFMDFQAGGVLVTTTTTVDISHSITGTYSVTGDTVVISYSTGDSTFVSGTYKIETLQGNNMILSYSAGEIRTVMTLVRV